MLDKISASEEQKAYADILFYGCWLGLVIMVITYSIYMLGILEPHVPFELLPTMWTKPVNEYLILANVPTGWGWASLLNTGDFINFIGIAFLAALSIICYLRVIPSFIRKNDKVMYVTAIIEVVVLITVMTGIVGAGAH